MKILVLANKFPYPAKDGGAIATLSFIKSLYNCNQEVTVLAINTIKHYSNVNTIPQNIKEIAQFNAVDLNTNVSSIGALKNLFFSKLPYTASRFISKLYSKKLQELLQNNSFDVIQIEGLYMCYYIPLIRKYSNAHIAFRAHNVETEIWERLKNETKFGFKKLYLAILSKRIKTFEKNQLNTYDSIIPITDKDATELVALGNIKPLHVAPTGIFISEDLQIEKKYPHTIFHIGGLDWAPNQQGILWFIDNCLPRLKQEHPDLIFKIAGRNAPKWFTSKLKVDGVEFVGEVDNAEIFIKENGIMIVPLLAGSGMRIKIIEGLCFGKAIVSTSIGAEGINAQHNNEICIANTAEDFIQSISQLLKNNSFLYSIEKNAITFVQQNFNNNLIIEGVIEFYKKLCIK